MLSTARGSLRVPFPYGLLMKHVFFISLAAVTTMGCFPSVEEPTGDESSAASTGDQASASSASGCIPIEREEACRASACGTKADGCGGSYTCTDTPCPHVAICLSSAATPGLCG